MRLNFGGYKWLKYDGYGRLCSGLARAMIRAGHDVHPFEAAQLDNPAWYLRAQGMDFGHATLQLMPPGMMRHVPGRSISFTMHESMNLPDGWAESINTKSQWCILPSATLLEVFEDVKVPIAIVPGGIDPDECQMVRPQRNRPFTFGCLGDRGSRKGHQLVWMAFYKAFDFKNHDVRLLIKCRPSSLDRLDFSYSSDSRLTVWRADVDQISDVYAEMDAFMFPTRFEGYGMPPRESAACGVPTFATRFSGTADDCEKWAFPLEKFKLVESNMDNCGGLWADPDLDELVWRMRDIYENQDRYREEAQVKAQWIRTHCTYAQAADKLAAQLSLWLGGPMPAPEPVRSCSDGVDHEHAILA